MSGRAIVVGAGIVGAACAEALARDGWRVQVLERDFPGGCATAQAMGHLVRLDDSPAQWALTDLGLRLWDERADDFAALAEWRRSGTVWVAADEGEWAHCRAKAEFFATRGVPVELLDATRLHELEPALHPALVGGLRVPGDAVLYPPAAARRLLARARDLGAEVHSGVEVRSLAPSRVTTGTEVREADLVVNAAGCAAPTLTAGLAIVPRRGHLVVTERGPELVHHQLVELGYLRSAQGREASSVAFNVQPRPAGQMLIGSSRDFAGLDPGPDRALLGRMLARAAAYLPALRERAALRIWTGFRPATPDKLPLIGQWQPGLFVAAGHEGLGVTTALATAALLADLAAGRSPCLDPAPFDPHRAWPKAA